MKNLEELEELNIKLTEMKKEIDNLESSIYELKEKYPEISAYDLATKSNVNEYIEKIREINKKQIQLQAKKLEYEKLKKEKDRKVNNNESIRKIGIKVNEPKVKLTNKPKIKNKITSVIAKGKDSTINEMKSKFKLSVGKIIGNVSHIYQKLCDLHNDEMNESKTLNQRLSDLENNYKKQKENQKINDIKSTIKIQKMYRQLLESNNQEQKETQIMSM